MNNILKVITLCAALAAPSGWAQSVRDVAATVPASSLILPESFETDTKAMLEDWYLSNYAVLDYDADRKPQGELNDELIIARLQALPVEIEMPLNGPVRNAISYYANRKRQLVENMLGLSLYYMPIFEEALERHGMPNELRYLPVIESALVPTAVSKAGAAGLWQFMPGTATGLGLEVNSLVDQRRDPYLASDAAARYLKQLYQTYGDWSLAIAAYNCGPGNVNKALRRAGDGKHDFWEIYPFLPRETRGYVPAFIAANYIMNYHKDHNISPALARKPIVTDTIHVSRRVHLQQISDVLAIPMSELRALNPQFRKDVIPGDIRPYSLVLPSLQTLAYIANEDSILNHDAAKYARRGYVEPASDAVTGRDAKGEYYDEEVVVYHKVKRGETLAKIAKRYGVTVARIRKYNKIGKSVKAGKRLKIVTVQRRYKPAPKPEPEQQEEVTTPADNTAAADSTATAAVDTTATPAQEVAAGFAAKPSENSELSELSENSQASEKTSEKTSEKPASQKSKKSHAKREHKQERKQPAYTTHTVRRGENLGKIARRYGVTVKDIQRANNMGGTNIQAGQKLKIPRK